ncbi:MAG: TonB-dependent receptor, partial [Muribaculaceae bacterium]|nr:TonB-dependent receptor [Muribaculaceae bacterium]
GYYMWRDRAKMELRGLITVRPIEALSVNVGGEARLKRRYYPGSLAGYVPLGTVADLTVGADYRFTPQFSVFAKGSNLLNRSWSEAIGVGVPCHGRTGLVGVTYLF